MKHPFIIDRPVTISNERVVGFILSRFRKQFNLLLIYFRENWPPIYQYVTSCVFLYHPCSDILNHSISYYLVFDSPPLNNKVWHYSCQTLRYYQYCFTQLSLKFKTRIIIFHYLYHDIHNDTKSSAFPSVPTPFLLRILQLVLI